MNIDQTQASNQNTPSYYDLVAEQYDDISSSNIHLAENAILKGILGDCIAGRRSDIRRILDLGCGTGLGYEIITELTQDPHNLQYEGYDISSKMLEVFRKKHGSDLNLQVSDFNAIHLDEMYRDIDLVLMTFGSFSYLESPEEFLQQLQAILTPDNGHIALMAYSRFSIRNQLLASSTGDNTYLAARRPYAFRNDTIESEKTPANFYTTHELMEMVTNAGFDGVVVQGMNFNTVSEEECASVEIAMEKLKEEIYASTCQDDAHALILSGRNYV